MSWSPDPAFDDLIAVDAVEDETHLYWWVRPSLRHPTVEFRACDTFLFVDDAVAVAHEAPGDGGAIGAKIPRTRPSRSINGPP